MYVLMGIKRVALTTVTRKNRNPPQIWGWPELETDGSRMNHTGFTHTSHFKKNVIVSIGQTAHPLSRFQNPALSTKPLECRKLSNTGHQIAARTQQYQKCHVNFCLSKLQTYNIVFSLPLMISTADIFQSDAQLTLSSLGSNIGGDTGELDSNIKGQLPLPSNNETVVCINIRNILKFSLENRLIFEIVNADRKYGRVTNHYTYMCLCEICHRFGFEQIDTRGLNYWCHRTFGAACRGILEIQTLDLCTDKASWMFSLNPNLTTKA